MLNYSVVKYVVPESAWPRVAGKQVDSQSWNAALNVVQKSLVEIAVANKLNKLSNDPVLAEAFRQCQKLQAKKHLEVVTTKQDLARKYGLSPMKADIPDAHGLRPVSCATTKKIEPLICV